MFVNMIISFYHVQRTCDDNQCVSLINVNMVLVFALPIFRLITPEEVFIMSGFGSRKILRATKRKRMSDDSM